MTDLSFVSFEPAEAQDAQPRAHCALSSESMPAAEPLRDQGVAADSVLAWLLKRAGLEPESYRATPLERRMTALLRAFRVSSPEAVKAMVETNPALLGRAIDTLLIGVTSVFRDAEVFEHLRANVLPDLLKICKGLRVLSAGVADGKELLSVALLLAEAGALEHSRLLGVECRLSGILEARQAFVRLADVDEKLRANLGKFLVPVDDGWWVPPAIRHKLEWLQADLVSVCFEPSSFDLILFRNVAIYLREPGVSRLWEKLNMHLASGGILVTGKAEKPPQVLGLKRLASAIYMKA